MGVVRTWSKYEIKNLKYLAPQFRLRSSKRIGPNLVWICQKARCKMGHFAIMPIYLGKGKRPGPLCNGTK